MQVDQSLLKNLVAKATCFQEQVPVFRIRPQNATELHATALKMLQPFIASSMDRELKFQMTRTESMTRLGLPEGAFFQYYHVSGYRRFDRLMDPFTRMVAEDAAKLDIESLKKASGDLLHKNQLDPSGSLESLAFERLWQLKACGVSREGRLGTAVVNRLVYAYRRSLSGLPVWGSASVYIKTAADLEVDSFGMDWRPVHDAHIHKAYVLDPEDGGRRILEELQNSNPEKPFTAKDFSVDSFSLGYFSDSKRHFQSFMQPVWVAKLISQGFSRMGRVIVVPATNTAYEPVTRKISPPPFNERRPVASPVCSCNKHSVEPDSAS